MKAEEGFAALLDDAVPQPPHNVSADDILSAALGQHRPSRVARWAAPLAAAALVGLVATALLLTGDRQPNRSPNTNSHVTGGTRGPTSPSHAAPPLYVGRAEKHTEIGNTQMTFDPPGDAKPAVAWQDAYRTACAHGCPTAGRATVTLASATIGDFGRAGKGGSVIPFVKNRLAYVVWFRALPCGGGLGGPPGIGTGSPQSQPSPTMTAFDCQWVDFVDARTGKELYIASGGLNHS